MEIRQLNKLAIQLLEEKFDGYFKEKKEDQIEESLEEAKKRLSAKEIILLDKSRILGVIPLNQKSFWFLRNFVNNDMLSWNKSNLGYAKSDEAIGKYSIDFLKDIMNWCYTLGESAKIKLSKDYPIWIEVKNDDGIELAFVLAPRIE